MHTKRLMTLLSVAAISGALLMPGLASARDRHGYSGPSDRWDSPMPRHRDWDRDWDRDWHRHGHHDRHHHRHDRWSRHYRRDRVRVYVDPPRRHRPAVRLPLGRDATLILR